MWLHITVLHLHMFGLFLYFSKSERNIKINKLCTIKNYIYLIIRLAGG